MKSIMIIRKKIKMLEKIKTNNQILLIQIKQFFANPKKILKYLNLKKKMIKYLMKTKTINKFKKNLWLNIKIKVKISLLLFNE